MVPELGSLERQETIHHRRYRRVPQFVLSNTHNRLTPQFVLSNTPSRLNEPIKHTQLINNPLRKKRHTRMPFARAHRRYRRVPQFVLSNTPSNRSIIPFATCGTHACLAHQEGQVFETLAPTVDTDACRTLSCQTHPATDQ